MRGKHIPFGKWKLNVGWGPWLGNGSCEKDPESSWISRTIGPRISVTKQCNPKVWCPYCHLNSETLQVIQRISCDQRPKQAGCWAGGWMPQAGAIIEHEWVSGGWLYSVVGLLGRKGDRSNLWERLGGSLLASSLTLWETSRKVANGDHMTVASWIVWQWWHCNSCNTEDQLQVPLPQLHCNFTY